MAIADLRQLFKRPVRLGTRRSDLEIPAPVEPYNFCAETYLAHFPAAADAGMDPWLHFLDQGFQRGFRPSAPDQTGTGHARRDERLATPVRAPSRNRFRNLRARIRPGAKILEVGPLFTPVAAKRDGYNTIVVDKLNKADLIAQYANHSKIDTSRIEEVDFVWGTGELAESIPSSHHMTFDIIIISHVIEHFPNPIGALRSFQKLLKPGGVLTLAVPDKRLCFDFLRPLTTTGAWLAAYSNKASVHDPFKLFDYHSSVAAHKGLISWPTIRRLDMQDITFSGKSLDNAYSDLVAPPRGADPTYRDCHAWVFTPSSFALTVNECHALGLISLVPELITTSVKNEFFVHLRLAARRPVNHHERLQFLAMAAGEQAAGFKKVRAHRPGWRSRLRALWPRH